MDLEQSKYQVSASIILILIIVDRKIIELRMAY